MSKKAVVRGPQLELVPDPVPKVKELILRMPMPLYQRFRDAMVEESKGYPPYAARPNVTETIISTIAEYTEFWMTVAQTDAGKVLVKGLKRKGARRG